MSELAALDQMRKHQPIQKAQFNRPVAVPPDAFDGLIDFTDCHFTEFKAQCACLFSPVKFENCSFENVDFHGTYFYGGFLMRNCAVNGRLGFECGGHNDKGEFALIDSQFTELVDFEDFWFTGPFSLNNVTFQNGTNLLGNIGTPVSVTFDVPPSLTAVTGQQDRNTYR